MDSTTFVKPNFYGRFLDDGQRLAQYNARVDKTYELCTVVTHHYEKKYPNLKGCFTISYPNILIAVGRYMNDLCYSVEAHDINNFHRSKIAAYTVRWFLIYNPVSDNIDKTKYASLSATERKIVFDINFAIIDYFIQYIFDDAKYLIDTEKSHNLLRRFRYYMKTDSYDAKMATLYFESHFG